MTVACAACGMYFDDAFRWTFCPHETFAANNGHNVFAHHPESYLAPFDADACNLITEQARGAAAWRVIHHLVAHPLIALSNGRSWSWRFHDWTLPRAWPGKLPIPKRRGLQ